MTARVAACLSGAWENPYLLDGLDRLYARLYADPVAASLPPRVRVLPILKYIDISKLAALTVQPGEVAAIRTTADALAREQDGRNPNIVDLAHTLSAQAADLPALAAGDPSPERGSSWRSVKGLEAPLVARVTATGTGGASRLPGDNR